MTDISDRTLLKRTDASPEELLRHAESDATFVAALVDWLERPEAEQPEPDPESAGHVSVEVLKTSQGFGMRETDPPPSQESSGARELS